MKHIITKRE